MTPYPHLFTPIKIGGQLIKNRIFSAPTGLMSYTARGHLTTENMAYYELKAKGGCGVVTLGESIVHAATGQSHDRQICLDDPHVLPSLTNTARAITRYGAVANIELSHGGKYAGLASIGGHKKERRPAYGPSHDILPSGEEVLEMPQRLIYEILDAYGAAADVAKRAGFGMVMVHAGHGWLFNQFLSPLENRRKDEFGGSLENRARFLLMALDRVRQAVGPGFPIQIRMNGDDFTEGGLHLEDYKELARMVESRVDLFNISCGSHERQELFVRTHPSAFLDHGCNVYLAAAIKQVVSKPVSCVGALGDPEQCEEIIASGQADIVELGRALLADPFLPKKAYTGQKEDITPCLRCFVCLGESEINGTNRCSVNPVIGAELEEKYYVAPPAAILKTLYCRTATLSGRSCSMAWKSRSRGETYSSSSSFTSAYSSTRMTMEKFCSYSGASWNSMRMMAWRSAVSALVQKGSLSWLPFGVVAWMRLFTSLRASFSSRR